MGHWIENLWAQNYRKANKYSVTSVVHYLGIVGIE